MPYITSIEQIGIEKGLEQGIEQGTLKTLRKSIFQVLKVRFDHIPPPLAETLNRVDDPNRLEKLLEQAVLAARVADFEQALADAVSDGEAAGGSVTGDP